MQFRFIFPLTALLASFFSLPVIVVAQQQYGIIEYVLPSAVGPIANGPDGGALWFGSTTSAGTHFIGSITPSGAITQYPVPGLPGPLTAEPEGALWFIVGSADAPVAYSIGRMTTSGVVTTYTPAHTFDDLYTLPGITGGPDGDLWFTDYWGLGFTTTSGLITQYEVFDPAHETPAGSIVIGSDGALWFLVLGSGNTSDVTTAIERCTTQFICTHYDQAAAINMTLPYGLAEGSDGAVWFPGTCLCVGRITTDGVITSYPVPNELYTIAAGRDGALWFGGPGEIVRMTTSGVVTEYPLPNPNAGAGYVANGPGGIWFVESDVLETDNRLGLMVPLTASLTADPSALKPGDDITLTGSGFAPGETVNLLYTSDLGKVLPAAITADSTGSFVITGQAGPSAFGSSSVSATGQSSRKLGVADLMVNHWLTLEPSSGSPGDTITANGGGLNPGSVTFAWQAWNGWSLGSATVDQVGRVTGFTFTIPADAQPGPKLILAVPSFEGPPPPKSSIAGANLNVLASSPSQ